MVLARRTTPSNPPQDPMMVDSNVCVPPTIEGPINSDNTVNLANLANSVDQAIPPRLGQLTSSHAEEKINMEQPPHNTNGVIPQCYARKIRPGIGKPVIGELHLALRS
uniref:Uncharacterized protein n=1 Tax=Cannabis sativa TaxID=3483 RepID=A0A803P2T5_CANSA